MVVVPKEISSPSTGEDQDGGAISTESRILVTFSSELGGILFLKVREINPAADNPV
jgi:hypothetical protein